METVFLKLLNLSIAAGWLVLVVIVLRLLLKKAPKAVMVVLWALVGIRLILPVSVQSIFSLIPSLETLPNRVLTGPSFDVNTGIDFLDNRVNDYLGDCYFEGVSVPANNGLHVMHMLCILWLVGIAVMLTYMAVSYFRIHRTVREATPLQDSIWLCDRIKAPFIFGVFRPRIFLPSSMGQEDMQYVIAHEKAHLKRHDHWWKPLGFLFLAVYWFHPLMWIAYILLCKDIELACDEKVIKDMGVESKKSYSEALINCSISRKIIAACPLAFGEVGVKERVKTILHYKKPAFWVIMIAAVVCVAVAVCFLTDPIPPFDDGIQWGKPIEIIISCGNYSRVITSTTLSALDRPDLIPPASGRTG